MPAQRGSGTPMTAAIQPALARLGGGRRFVGGTVGFVVLRSLLEGLAKGFNVVFAELLDPHRNTLRARKGGKWGKGAMRKRELE